MTQDSVARQSLLSRPTRRIVRQSLFTLSLLLLLFTPLLGDWAFPLPYASASGHPHATPVPGTLTLAKFLREGHPDPAHFGAFRYPLNPSQPPLAPRAHPLDMTHLPPSAEPTTMKPLTLTLDTAFLNAAATSKPLDLVGSDQRLEVLIPPGAFDLSHATTTTGTPVTTPATPTPTSVSPTPTKAPVTPTPTATHVTATLTPTPTPTHVTGSVTPTTTGTHVSRSLTPTPTQTPASTPTATSTPVSAPITPAVTPTTPTTPTPTGTPASGPLTLTLTQDYGHFPAQTPLLGGYTLQLRDSAGHPLSGVLLRTALTYRFHYQAADLALFDLDPAKLFLSFPVLIRAARSQHRPLGDLVAPLLNDAQTHTLSGQSHGFGPFDLGGNTDNQSPPVPHLASVGGNAGQLSYSYPLTLAPGVGVPPLTLSYSSQSTNERHSITSPSSSVGEGWSLSLGSISADVYTAQDAGGVATWYSLSGAGVSDRLVPNSHTPTSFLTQHISPLKIVQVTSSFGQPCFNVWDAAGTEYLFGCTSDSLQYQTDSTGKRTNYRWDLNNMAFSNEGPDATSGITQVSVSYLQDIPSSSHTTVRDAVIKQIVTRNVSGTVVSTVDFLYKAPFTSVVNGITWASAYGNNYNCTAIPNHPVPNPPTTLRCDDPLDFTGGLKAPAVISTFSLQSVWNHAGDDNTNTNLAYRYDFTYTDHPFWSCWDDWTQIQENCSGDHLLTALTPTVYLKGTAYARKGLSLTYNTGTNNYVDTTQTVHNQPTQYYGASTYWNYLSAYMDTDTAQGASISYKDAYNNTHGSPATSDDNRIDPFYCPVHAGNPLLECSGAFAYPQDRAWTYHVVSQITASGSDSSAVSSATSTYTYGLQVTASSGCPNFQGDSRCVGDNWLPAGSTNFLNYYQAEFRGFANVYLISPASELTLQTYYSTEGWFTNANSFFNYLGASLWEEKVYQGSWITAPVLRDTLNTYAGTMAGQNDSCNGNYSGLYTPCAVLLLRSRTTFLEGSSNPTPPWVQQDNTYDDYTTMLIAGYNNLIQQVVTSSNAPTLTRKWSYTTNDQTVSGWVYHTVNRVTHSEVDDSAGKVWSCQDTSYDQGVSVSAGKPQPPTPAQGLSTTSKSYSDCANQGSSAITTYAGYDGSGSPVATVDGVGAANPNFYGSTGIPTKNGCTLSSAPAVFPTSWGKTNYNSCAVYDGTTALPTSVTNAFSQQSSITYDLTQGALPTSRTDINSQMSSLLYSIDSHGNRTTQLKAPGESGLYTTQSSTNSTSGCPASIPTSLHLPCYEIDNTSSQYTQAISSTSYDALGRATETRTAGPDATHDTIVFTVSNDAVHSLLQSVPFEVTHGTGWVDPNGAIDPVTNKPVTGTATFYDALGRVLAVQDPAIGTGGDGISCVGLTGSYTACSTYTLGTASGSGDTNVYAMTTSLDPNKHVSLSFADALGRTIYAQEDSGLSGGTLTPIQLKSVQYNVLNEPTSVTVLDQAPQANQSTTSVTTTAQYDSLGRLTQLVDPDRGTHTYTYDPDSHLLTDVSGTRTLGSNYDLLGRVGCLQDAAPTINATGACSSGHALVQNTYDVSAPGVSWPPSDYPIGRLTQSIATTIYPQGASGSVTQSSEYDQRGRVITHQLTLGLPSGWNVTTALPTYQMALGYNDANQLTTTTTSTLNPTGTGFTTSQVYDSTTGMLTGLSKTLTAVPNLASLSFNGNGLVSDLKVGTSTDTSTPTLANEHFSYDGDLRPSETTATWLSGSGSSGQIFDQSRWYDPASNVTSLSTTHAAVPGQSGSGGSETSNFCYNEQSQLIWAGNSGSQPAAGNGTCGSQTLSAGLSGASYSNTFAYTHLGQLWQGPLAGSGATSQYLYCAAGTHQLDGLYPTGTTCSTKSGALYTSSYDPFGNVTSRTTGGATSTLSYDALDHLSKWTSGANNEYYLYDAGGNRVLRRSISGGSTTLTTYAFGLEEHTYSGTGTLQSNTYYYRLAGHLIGELTGSPSPLSTSIFLTDPLGSILATFSNTANSAALLGNQVYGPYGTQRYTKGAMGTTKGFTGQYNDTLTGLNYYNARYYDPAVGVFVSVDVKQGNLQGMNPYAYVGGNPETKNDPTGQRFACPDPNGCNGGSNGTSTPTPTQSPDTSSVSPTSTSSDLNSGSYITLWTQRIKLYSAVTRFYTLLIKFLADDLILKNAAGSIADLAGTISLGFPVVDNPSFYATFGLNNTNTGQLQHALQYKDGEMGGLVPAVELLGHLANAAAVGYAIADLAYNLASDHRNGYSMLSDFLTLASLGAYYAYKFLKGTSPALLHISIALGVVSSCAQFMSYFPPPDSSSSSNDRRDGKQDGFGGGGGFPPLPPLIPAALFLEPQPNTGGW